MSTAIGLSVHDSSLYIPDLRPRRKESVLQELVAHAEQAGAVRRTDILLETLSLRERLGSTAIGKGVAIPNARSIAISEPRLVFARSRRGIDWKAPDDLPVQLVFLVLSPSESTLEVHHEFLARCLQLARLQRDRQRLIEGGTPEQIGVLLREALQ